MSYPCFPTKVSKLYVLYIFPRWLCKMAIYYIILDLPDLLYCYYIPPTPFFYLHSHLYFFKSPFVRSIGTTPPPFQCVVLCLMYMYCLYPFTTRITVLPKFLFYVCVSMSEVCTGVFKTSSYKAKTTIWIFFQGSVHGN